MNFIIKISFSLWILTLASSGMAATMTLSQALNTGAENSPQLQKAKSLTQEAHDRESEASAGFWPTVTGSANTLLNKNYVLVDFQLPGNPTTSTIPQVVPSSNFQLNAQWPLFDGFSSVHSLRAAKAFSHAAEQDWDWAQFQIQRQIALQFYKALGMKLLKEVAEQNLKTVEDHLRDVTLFKKAGVSTSYDVLRVEVQASEARSELMNAADNIEIAQGALAERLGLTEKVEPQGALPILAAQQVQNLKMTTPSSERKDLAGLQQRSEGSRWQQKAADGAFWPHLSLFGQYQYYNNRTDNISDREAYRDGYLVGLQLNWVLFDGFSISSHSHILDEQAVQVEKNLRIATLRAQQDFEVWRRKFLYNCSVYRSRLEDIQRATESVRLAKEGRKVGARTNTDLLDAEAELFRARAGAVNAQVGSIESLINLELATGQKLFSNLESKE